MSGEVRPTRPGDREPTGSAWHATARWLGNPPNGARRVYPQSRGFNGVPFSIPDGDLFAHYGRLIRPSAGGSMGPDSVAPSNPERAAAKRRCR